MEIQVNGLQDLPRAARQFLAESQGRSPVVAFYGSMGAGKTTFIKALCDVLGVEDVVNSPTFAIVNEYTAASGEPVYHFDFYRIKSGAEAYDFGYENYFYSGHLCLVEWPEMVEELLPDDALRVHIEVVSDQVRLIKCE